MMLFSILIANYNNSAFLQTALKSVFEQHYTNWEIILVDDGSTDDFDKCMEPFSATAGIKISRNGSNKGCGFTKRRCAENASGELMAFLDPDDALHPDALQIMVAAHQANSSCSLISSTHFICDERLQVKRKAEYTSALPPGVPYLLLGDGRVHHFASFKKSCYLKTSGISPHNKKAVDQDLYYKLEEAGDLFFIDIPLYYYRIHSGGISTTGKENEALKVHYSVIEEACLRRIGMLDRKNSASKSLIKKYRTKYYKIRIFNSFRRKNWTAFAYNMAVFPFVGGMENLLSYIKKLPEEGIGLLRKSFITNYQIKP